MLDKINLNLLELLSVLLPGGILLFLLCLPEIPEKESLMQHIDVERLQWYQGVLIFGISFFLGYVCYVGCSLLDRLYNYL